MDANNYKDLVEPWIFNREQMNIQKGSISRDFANIWLPDKNNVLSRVWSFQDYDLDGAAVLYDYPIYELDWNHKNNPLPILGKYINEEDFYNPKSLHIGLLTKEALSVIVRHTYNRGWLAECLQDTENFVYYRPDNFIWAEYGSWRNVAKQEQEKKNDKNKTLSLLAAAAAIMIN